MTYLGRVVPANDDSGSMIGDWAGIGSRLSASGASYITVTLRGPPTLSRLRLTTWQYDEGAFYPEAQPWVIPALGSPAANGTVEVDVPIAAFETTDVIWATQVPPQYWSRTPLVIVRYNTDGTFQQAASFTRSLEFIGDSITAATNMHAHPPCGDEGFQSDVGQSYSTLLCRNFTAACSIIAVGGKGLVRNCCDQGATMPVYYRNAMYSEMSAVPWAFPPAQRPDGIVVALGTNDYDHGGSPGLDANFTAAYVAFIANATQWYGATPGEIQFFALVGPMSNASLNATAAAVATATAAGYAVTLVNVYGIPCTGCAGHPSVDGHAAMAAALQPVMAAALKW